MVFDAQRAAQLVVAARRSEVAKLYAEFYEADHARDVVRFHAI